MSKKRSLNGLKGIRPPVAKLVLPLKKYILKVQNSDSFKLFKLGSHRSERENPAYLFLIGFKIYLDNIFHFAFIQVNTNFI